MCNGLYWVCTHSGNTDDENIIIIIIIFSDNNNTIYCFNTISRISSEHTFFIAFHFSFKGR